MLTARNLLFSGAVAEVGFYYAMRHEENVKGIAFMDSRSGQT
jgi:hypothetical protein